MSFEETAPDLTLNVKSLGFDLDTIEERKKLAIDHVRVEKVGNRRNRRIRFRRFIYPFRLRY